MVAVAVRGEEIICEGGKGRGVGLLAETRTDLLGLIATTAHLRDDAPRPQTKHRILGKFNSWAEIEREAEYSKGITDLTVALGIVSKWTLPHLSAIAGSCQEVVDAKRADCDVVVVTAHKAKGLEWDSVRIGDDFYGRIVSRLPGAARGSTTQSTCVWHMWQSLGRRSDSIWARLPGSSLTERATDMKEKQMTQNQTETPEESLVTPLGCNDERLVTHAVDRAARGTKTYVQWVEALAEGGLLPDETPTDRQTLLRTHLRHGLNLVGATAHLIESSAVLAQIESVAYLPAEIADQVFLSESPDELGSDEALVSVDAVMAAFVDVLGAPDDSADVLEAERQEGTEH